MINIKNSNPYKGYLYSYPHKTTYRNFTTPVDLKEIWKNEDKSALFFYLHIPFCNSKCGFCNLFSISKPDGRLVEKYIDSVEIQAEATKNFLGNFKCARYAIGGGTPSFLNYSQLKRVLDIFSGITGNNKSIPGSFETSPDTITEEKLELLYSHEVQRISVGIQSFDKSEVHFLSRVQSEKSIHSSLSKIKELNFPVLNIDLIYGIKGQTPETLQNSIKKALYYEPEEIYLYPLYIRSHTKLEGTSVSKNTFSLYEKGRDYLLENGYTQISMRMFQKSDSAVNSEINSTPAYCCQEDGMIGLGTGARSYTKDIHYSSRYAVRRKPSIDIVEDYINQTDNFYFAKFGFKLSLEEKKRRYLIKSFLRCSGLVRAEYNHFFSTDCVEDFHELNLLEKQGLATISDEKVKLTNLGIAYSDSIGPELISSKVKNLIKEYTGE